MAAILLAFVLPRLIVPPTLGMPLLDDWLYQLSVKRLVEGGGLWISPLTVTSLAAQVGWGALFSLPFGVSPAALRLSTAVAAFGGCLACYGLFRELGATRLRATLGALAVSLSPVCFVLSYTFMSDVPYLALLSLSSYVVVRAVRRGAVGQLAIGSAVAGLAFLVRQQGAIVPLATLGWLMLARPAWFRMSPWRAAAATLGPCLVAVAGYLAWTTRQGVPQMQATFAHTLLTAGVGGTLNLTWRIAVVALFYLGLCALPLVLGAASGIPDAWRLGRPGATTVVVTVLAGLVLWTVWFAGAHDGRGFPFLTEGSMIRDDGFATDAYGARPPLFAPWLWSVLAVLFALSAAGALLLILTRDRPAAMWASPAGLVSAIGLGQFAGILPGSLYRPQAITYDRYLLPLFPFAVGLVLWAMRDRPFSPILTTSALLVVMAVSTLGVQDWVAFKQASWGAARWLVQDAGVPLDQVDGYGQWDGLHFYEQTLAHPDAGAPGYLGAPWWLTEIAPRLDPVYVVAASGNARRGYRVVARRPFNSWIRPSDESWVYVLKRQAGGR